MNVSLVVQKFLFNKFEDMLKFLFTRMEGINNSHSISQKPLVSYILRELI